MGWSHGDEALPSSALGHSCRSETSQQERAFAVLGGVSRKSPHFLGIFPEISWNGIPSVPGGLLPISADNAPVACLLASGPGTFVPVIGAREFDSLHPTLHNCHGVAFDSVALTWCGTRNQTGKIVLGVPCALLSESFHFAFIENVLLKILPMR